MNLGPNNLKPTHRTVINRKENKRLIKKYLKGKCGWEHRDLKNLKMSIRLILREQQKNRCIYCRRIIKIDRRNVSEDIEHFLDKSKGHYKKWAFSPVNLTLACRCCNFVKSTKELGDQSVRSANRLQPGIGVFRWLHPYFDNYHDNIEIRKGWIYSIKPGAPNPIAAHNMITDCELYKIQTVERNNEVIKKRQERLISLIELSISKGQYQRSAKFVQWLKIEQNKSWFDY